MKPFKKTEQNGAESDTSLARAFERIIREKNLSSHAIDIAKLVCGNSLNRDSLRKTLEKYNIDSLNDIKDELLDLILHYANIALDDNIITANEYWNIKMLKMYFKIREGAFYTRKHAEIELILKRQFERLYSDNRISQDEAVFNVNLQGIFDLSYDQYDRFKKQEVRKALEQGANITDLDTALCPGNRNKRPE